LVADAKLALESPFAKCAMTRELTDTILRVVKRAPQWIRRDLEAKNPAARIRAEEALAAMIAEALNLRTAADADAET
jgi:hypothetical protein